MRIAIVGGTFSPPHNGHVALALCARDGLNADRVLIMPNAAPPHKFCGVSKLDRREMTRLAFMDVKKTELDETELFSPQVSPLLKHAHDGYLFFPLSAWHVPLPGHCGTVHVL